MPTSITRSSILGEGVIPISWVDLVDLSSLLERGGIRLGLGWEVEGGFLE